VTGFVEQRSHDAARDAAAEDHHRRDDGVHAHFRNAVHPLLELSTQPTPSTVTS
jgi:hypothetical protein